MARHSGMRGLMNRREALLTTITVAALAGRWPAFAASQPPPRIDADIPRLFIDAHCHVFNAHDIPMKSFIVETAVRESPDLKPWVGVASLLSWLIRLWVDISDNELSLIDFPGAHPPAVTREMEDEQFHTLVGNSVQRVAAEAAGGADAQRSQELDPFAQAVMKYGLLRAPELFQVQTRSAPLPLNLSAVSINYLLAQYGQQGLQHAESGTQLRELRSEELGATVPLRAPDASLRSLTDSLVSDSKTQSTDVGSIMSLARIIASARMRNIEALDESLGVSAASPAITRLYVPALVDFDCWFGDATTSLAMWKQTSIMSKLSKRQTDPGRFANGYVPFDPLRAVLIETGVVSDLRSPLEVVGDAIESGGFLGAKLYPPMGFRAWTNAELKNEDFGEKVQPWIAQIKQKTNNPDFQLGPALDASLMKLYGYCLSNDVPIMAHCSNSQTSFTGSGERASPAYWMRLLEQSDPASGAPLANLRVNLGHFGSIWCHEHADTDDANPDSETARCHVAYDWPDIIVKAITPSSGGRYPDAGAWLHDLLQNRTADEQQAILSHMLYGTDWMFLVLFGKSYVNYIQSVHDLMRDRPGASTKIFHENAARFLGLTQNGRTAQRLRAFYADDPDRLQRFETLLV
jgi:predicted TIM-barrel fold metal-dependent hydrolase